MYVCVYVLVLSIDSLIFTQLRTGQYAKLTETSRTVRLYDNRALTYTSKQIYIYMEICLIATPAPAAPRIACQLS